MSGIFVNIGASARRNGTASPLARILLPVFLAAMVFTPLPAHGQHHGAGILIGLLPEVNVFQQMERFRPLAEYLTETMGVRVNVTLLSQYCEIIPRLADGSIDAAFLGSFTGALAIRKLGAIPLARPVNLDGESTYHGHIYVRRDSGIRDYRDMRDKRIAMVEKATTAGYVFPLAYLRENGVSDVSKFFSEIFFAGSHDAALYAVLEGDADIGASKNTVFDWIKDEDPRVKDEIVVIAESPAVPSNGLFLRKGMAAGIGNGLKKALLELDKTEKGKEVLGKLKASGFVATTAADYMPVFDLAKKAGVDLDTFEDESHHGRFARSAGQQSWGDLK